MKSKAHKAKSGSSDPRRARPRRSCRSAGACSGRRSWCSGWCAGRAWTPCRGRTRCRRTSSSSWQRVFVEQGKRGLRTEGRAGGAGADPGAREDWRADDAPGAGRGSHRKKGLHGRVEEAQGMRQRRSPGTGRRYPLDHDLRDVSAGAVVGVRGGRRRRRGSRRASAGPKTRAQRRGAASTEIRAVLAACPFHGEGYRKVRARLAHRGYAASGKRVLRLMRAHGLLAPRRLGPPNGNPAHDGTITTERPDVMWGTDGTRFYTEQDGWCWFFGAIDHHLDEVVGWHVAKLGDRWAALEPIRQGVRHAFGRFGKDVARGLGAPVRLGPAVHRRRVDQRGEVAGVHDLAVVRRGTGVQRGRGALHAHAQGAVHLPASVPRPRGGAPGHRRVHRALQHRVAHRAPGVSNAGASACGCPAEGRMSEMTGRRAETEGRRGSRSASTRGVAMSVSP